MAFDFSHLVGVPWRDRGRDLAGCDCWGLHRIAVRIGLGVELPSYREDYAGPADRAAIQALMDGDRSLWRPVERGAERPFDLVLLRGNPWHVGTVVSRGRMLHVPEGHTSVIEPFATGRFGRRIEGLYRHEAAA